MKETRELGHLRDKIKKRWWAGEITEEAYDEGLLLIRQVESFLV